jgi:hypothetical protein
MLLEFDNIDTDLTPDLTLSNLLDESIDVVINDRKIKLCISLKD